MTQTNSQPDDNLLASLNRHILLVMLHISWPKLSYQIADAVVEIRGDGNITTEVDVEYRTNPQWQLMPEEWRKRFSAIEGRARAILSSVSVKFAAKGITALPTSRAATVFTSLRELRDELERDRDEFISDYSNVLSNLKDKLGDDLYDKAAEKLPSEQDVRKKFGMVWAIVPAGGSGVSLSNAKLDTVADALRTARADAATTADELVLDEAMHIIGSARDNPMASVDEEEAEELINEARQQMNQLTQQMLQDMAREPRQMLTDAADNLLEALNNPERAIRTGTISQVQRAFEMVEGFSFLADSELLSRIRDCNNRLNSVTPQEINSDSEIGARLAEGLRSVREQASDAVASAKAVRSFRNINIGRQEPVTT